MKVEFGDLSWHDAELLEVRVDRREPGDSDTVVLLVRWPSGAIDEVCFFDSYGLDARMNFGVVAAETVLEGRVFENSPELSKLQKKWKAIGVKLDDVKCFEIETNSTGSLLRVYARGVRSIETGLIR